jgi:hypothetical protein
MSGRNLAKGRALEIPAGFEKSEAEKSRNQKSSKGLHPGNLTFPTTSGNSEDPFD